MSNLIPHSHAARMARRADKQRKILAFLRTEIWTVPEIIGLVAGVRDPRTIESTLKSMVRDDLLVTEECTLQSGRRIALFGISMDGQAHVAHLLDKPLIDKSYERGRAGLSLVDHRCDCQMLRIRLALAGWTGWMYPDRVSVAQKSKAGMHRADAITTTPGGVVAALEVERSVKNGRRYRSIFAHHLSAISRGEYARVIYASPSIVTSRAVNGLFTSIDQVIVGGRETTVTAEMLSHFQFLTYAELTEGAAK